MNYKYGQVIHAIESKVPGETRSGSEQNKSIVLDGKKVGRVTFPKKHGGSIPPGTLNSIKKQLKLDRTEFARLIECPMTQAEYIEILTELSSNGKL